MIFIDETAELRLSFISLIFGILLLNTKIFCFQSLCTTLPDIKPCKCLQNSIVCTDIRGDFDLENISKILDSNRNNSSFAEFSLYNTSIIKIGNVFNSVAFKLISISYNQNLSDISDKAFSGSADTVPIVSVVRNDKFPNSNSTKQHISDLMAQFNQIRYILLPHNAITSLPTHLFHLNNNKLVELTYLNLRENNITRIESKTFIDLEELKSINLGQNKISFIDDSAFVLNANITTALIQIDYNELNSSSFASNWFSTESLNTSAKIDIDLSHNSITFLDQHIFEAILSNNYNIVLTVRYNPFQCDCRSKWLVNKKGLYLSKVRWMTCEDNKDIWLKTDKDFSNCSSKQSFNHFNV